MRMGLYFSLCEIKHWLPSSLMNSKKQIRTNFDLRNSSDLLRFGDPYGNRPLVATTQSRGNFGFAMLLGQRGSDRPPDGHSLPRSFDSRPRHEMKTKKTPTRSVFFVLVTRTGIEPMFSPWEGDVLAAWPTGLSACPLYHIENHLSIGFWKNLRKKFFEKSWKNFKKSIDKWFRLCYNNRAP